MSKSIAIFVAAAMVGCLPQEEPSPELVEKIPVPQCEAETPESQAKPSGEPLVWDFTKGTPSGGSMRKGCRVSQDGIFGNMTLSALNGYNPQRELFSKLWNRRKIYLEGCKSAPYHLKGWLRRLNDYKFEN